MGPPRGAAAPLQQMVAPHPYMMQQVVPGQPQMMMIPCDMIGAIKIKDGLFIGDEFAAQVRSIKVFAPSNMLHT